MVYKFFDLLSGIHNPRTARMHGVLRTLGYTMTVQYQVDWALQCKFECKPFVTTGFSTTCCHVNSCAVPGALAKMLIRTLTIQAASRETYTWRIFAEPECNMKDALWSREEYFPMPLAN